MSEPSEPKVEEPAAAGSVSSTVGENDWTLQDLVSIANASPADYALSITLTTPSGVITGKLIPNWRWFEEQDLKIRQLTQSDKPIGLGVMFARHAAAFQPPDREHNSSKVGFIHLKEARVISGTALLPVEGMHWRGMLSHVSGWSLGELRLSDQ